MLRARLTKRAQTAYQKFTEEAKASYEESKKALQERFEPKCKRQSSRPEGSRRQKVGPIVLKTSRSWSIKLFLTYKKKLEIY